MPEFSSRFPVLGSPNPSYPALCRQATSYAWRNRLRRIPLGRSEDARREVRECGARHSVAALGGQNPGGARVFLAGLGGPGGQTAAPKAGRKGATRRAIHYAQCVLEDRGAKCEGKRNIFWTSAKKSKCCSQIKARNTLRTAMFR